MYRLESSMAHLLMLTLCLVLQGLAAESANWTHTGRYVQAQITQNTLLNFTFNSEHTWQSVWWHHHTAGNNSELVVHIDDKGKVTTGDRYKDRVKFIGSADSVSIALRGVQPEDQGNYSVNINFDDDSWLLTANTTLKVFTAEKIIAEFNAITVEVDSIYIYPDKTAEPIIIDNIGGDGKISVSLDGASAPDLLTDITFNMLNNQSGGNYSYTCNHTRWCKLSVIFTRGDEGKISFDPGFQMSPDIILPEYTFWIQDVTDFMLFTEAGFIGMIFGCVAGPLIVIGITAISIHCCCKKRKKNKKKKASVTPGDTDDPEDVKDEDEMTLDISTVQGDLPSYDMAMSGDAPGGLQNGLPDGALPSYEFVIGRDLPSYEDVICRKSGDL